jgi:hypothetical protein
VTIGGAAGGGSAWSPSRADVFYSIVRRNDTSNLVTFLVGWQHGFGAGNTQHLIQTGAEDPLTGLEVLDLEFARTASGPEGWALGQSFSGSQQLPFVAHLN